MRDYRASRLVSRGGTLHPTTILARSHPARLELGEATELRLAIEQMTYTNDLEPVGAREVMLHSAEELPSAAALVADHLDWAPAQQHVLARNDSEAITFKYHWLLVLLTSQVTERCPLPTTRPLPKQPPRILPPRPPIHLRPECLTTHPADVESSIASMLTSAHRDVADHRNADERWCLTRTTDHHLRRAIRGVRVLRPPGLPENVPSWPPV